jgi:predicted nucleotidyltransferase component of viral defense system
MIDRREILETATRMSLNPHVVEKDYVLGWLLAGIDAHPVLRETWVFKGGTCLKKCFFETYRFSEDLDFTLKDPAQLEEGFLKGAFAQIGTWIHEQTGLLVPAEAQRFEILTNPRGTISCEGRIYYRGPVSPRDMPRVKLDLTADERLVLPPVRARVFHPYTDDPAAGIWALAYAYEEVFGEKVRALAERTRPRDLYDVINLFRNVEALPAPAVLRDVLAQKCEFKGIGLPVLAALEAHRGELEGLWANMLQHQLPSLPPYETFWNELPGFFAWLAGGQAPRTPAAFPVGAGETVLRDRVLRLGLPGQTQAIIEIIRFAAGNRLLVELSYQGSTRLIEPYSLRRTRDGTILLHAHNVDRDQHRSYRVDQIAGARATNRTYIPRHEVELGPQSPLRVPPTPPRAVAPTAWRAPKPATRRVAPPKARLIIGKKPKARKSSGHPGGLTYTFRCPVCKKTFRRSKYDSRLNQHKNPRGYPCPGRSGIFVKRS